MQPIDMTTVQDDSVNNDDSHSVNTTTTVPTTPVVYNQQPTFRVRPLPIGEIKTIGETLGSASTPTTNQRINTNINKFI